MVVLLGCMYLNISFTFCVKARLSVTAIWNSKIIRFVFSVADYVFFENSSSNPYLIRRIEELNKVLKCLGVPFMTLYAQG